MSFENKVVIVTGAGSGIGAATAILFAKEGANLVLADINESNLKLIGEQVDEYGKQSLLITANVSNDEDANNLVKQAIAEFKKIDVLVNNAGSIKLGNILGGNCMQTFDEMIKNNLRSAVLLMNTAAPFLIKSKGNIVNVSSTLACRNSTVPHLMPYSVSKIGIEHATRGAAMELAPSGVRVNAVRPGGVKTNIVGLLDGARILMVDPLMGQMPLGKLAEPEEIARIILFLASDKSGSVTGSIYTCDNGMLLK